MICELITTLLGVERVGINDHFFHLGGHSLVATRLASQIRLRLGCDLPLRMVFELPVVRDLAHALAELPQTSTRPLAPRSRSTVLPASSAQARLSFLQELEGDSSAYHIPIAMRLRGRLDVASLGRAIDDLRVRHESLRTVLEHGVHGLQQRILAPSELPLALTQVSTTEATLDVQLAAAAAIGFNLAEEPSLRATLFTLSAQNHVLLLLMHHCAADGWSVTPLIDDLGVAYRARCSGVEPAFTELPVQYADHTLWLRDRLGDSDDPASIARRQLAYWREQLADLPDEIRLPADRPRTIDDSGSVIAFRVPAKLHARLATVARAHQATLFMVLVAALAAFLERMGAGTDIPIGVPIAGRSDAALDRLVGFFVNTLVLRTDLRGNPTFAELLSRVRATCLDAYANQDLPFERVVESLDPVREPGRQPLFQTMLVLQPEAPLLTLPDIVTTFVPVEKLATKFDLTVTFTERIDADGRPGGLSGELEYRSQRFNQSTAATLAARLVRMLEQLAENPVVALYRVELLEEGERRWLLEEVSGASASSALPATATVIERFEQTVRRTPNALALITESETLTYAQLEEASNRLAWFLLSKDAGPEDRIALAFGRSPNLIVAILATLKCGAAYLPLDPEVPSIRLAGLIADARPRLVLTTNVFAGRFAALKVERICIDSPGVLATLATRPSIAPTSQDLRTILRMSHPAYLLYTSGSTGVPKGVVISHESLARYLDSVSPVLGKAPLRMLLFTASVFDLTVTTFFAPLCSGGQIEIASAEHPAETVASLVSPANEATAVKLTPTHLSLLPAPSPGNDRLRTVIVGGEALTGAHVAAIRAHNPDIRIFNEYGPTETTVGVTGAWVEPHDVSIGRPYSHMRAYVLDAGMQPCPLNVLGELYLAGSGLARGYLGRPGLTAERFVAHPFATSPGERIYRTGDLAAWRPDGNIAYFGRADRQVKIRGVRIEPAEIEGALLQDASVAQAAVVAREGAAGCLSLIAYLVPSASLRKVGRAFDLDALHRRLSALLPDPMLPAAYIVLAALPLTRNGKLDRAALPAPDNSGSQAEFLAPTTAVGAVLCEVTAELLGLLRVGLRDNFFRIGGHSLLATRLVTQLRARLGRELPLRTLFELPDMGALAKALEALPKVDKKAPLLPDLAAAFEPFPLTPVQEAYWLGRQGIVALGDVACHVYMELRVANLNLAAFERAWQEAIVQHPMLRAVVEADGSQRILPHVPSFSIPCTDCSAMDVVAAEAAARVGREELSHQILPPSRWPLFEIRVTRLPANEWRSTSALTVSFSTARV